jgi:hypothetical protein
MRRAILRIVGPLLLIGAVLLPLHAFAADKPAAGDAPLRVTYYYLPG